MIASRDSVRLCICCFKACEALKTAIEGGDADRLDGYVSVAIEDLGRCVDLPYIHDLICLVLNPRVTSEIMRTLERGDNMQHVKSDEGMIRRSKLEIQDILDDLNELSLPFSGGHGVSLSDDPSVAAATSISGPGGGS